MPEEIPKFESTPLPVEPSPTEAVLPKKTRRSAPAARKPTSRAKKISDSAKVRQESTDAISRELTAIYQDPDGSLPDMKKIELRRANRFGSFIIGLLVIGVLGAGLMWARFLWWADTGPAPESLNITIAGPENAPNGATTTYTFSYANTTERALNDATLNIYSPAGFVILTSSVPAIGNGKNEWPLGTIPPYSKGSLSITGLSFGDVNSSSSWRLLVRYQPEKFNSTLEQTAALIIKNETGVATVSANSPAETQVNSDVTFTFSVKNSAFLPPGRVELIPSFPNNFVIGASSPLLQNARWSVTPKKTTSTADVLTYKVTGKFTSGGPSTTPVSAALVYTPNGQTSAFRIAMANVPILVNENAVGVSLAINGKTGDFDTKPGDALTITVRAKNASPDEIKNATLKLVMDAPTIKKQSLLLWPEIKDPLDGNIIGEQISDSVRRGTITWTSKIFPALSRLKSGSEAAADVYLPIRSGEQFDLASIDSFVIIATPFLTYTDKSGAQKNISAAPINITVNSDLAFENRVKFTTTDGKKQYDLNWIVSNSFHALKNVEVSATLFGDVSFKAGSPTAGATEYRENDKTVIWKIADLPVSVDIATFPFTVVLNKDNPSQTALSSKIRVQADDTATGRRLDFTSEEISLIAQ